MGLACFSVLAVISSSGVGTSSHLGVPVTSGVITLTLTTGGPWSPGRPSPWQARRRSQQHPQGLARGEGALGASSVSTGCTGRFEGETGSGSVASPVDEDGVRTAEYVETIDHWKKLEPAVTLRAREGRK